jgi:cysteine desulfurase
MHSNRGKHIITSNAEHPAVLRCVEQLEKEYGFNVTVLPINKDGVVTLEQIKAAITEETILVSIMAVNNETGAISAIEDIAKLLLKHPKIAFHVDATQAIGKINIDYSNVDLISFSGHKIHALKNSGALIKNKNISLLPQNCGGGHENGYRSGTVDVASSASLAKAVRLVTEDIDSKTKLIKKMAEKLYQYLEANKDLYVLHSTLDNPYIINFSLLIKKASVVVEALSNEGIMVSSVSACHSKGEPLSHVIMALTNNSDLAHNTLRISLDSSNKLEEIDILIENLHRVIGGVR